MNGTFLTLVASYLVAAAVTAWMISQGHGQSVASLLALPLLCLAHASWKLIAGRGRSGKTKLVCLACQQNIGRFRRLGGNWFCCEEHEKTYLAELEELSLQRLTNARLPPAENGANPVFAPAPRTNARLVAQSPREHSIALRTVI